MLNAMQRMFLAGGVISSDPSKELTGVTSKGTLLCVGTPLVYDSQKSFLRIMRSCMNPGPHYEKLFTRSTFGSTVVSAFVYLCAILCMLSPKREVDFDVDFFFLTLVQRKSLPALVGHFHLLHPRMFQKPTLGHIIENTSTTENTCE